MSLTTVCAANKWNHAVFALLVLACLFWLATSLRLLLVPRHIGCGNFGGHFIILTTMQLENRTVGGIGEAGDQIEGTGDVYPLLLKI